LSPREYDVVLALADGHSNKVIARQLDLTENTVKFHLRSLYEKLGVNGRMLAVAVAREKGILPSS
jgi:LuxR family maltose regulon positive regulatory protein